MTLQQIFSAIQELPAKIATIFADANKTAAKVAELEAAVTAAQAAAADANQKTEGALADLAKAKEENAKLRTELNEAKAAAALFENQLTLEKANAKTAEQHGEEIAKTKIGSLGVPPISEPAQDTTAPGAAAQTPWQTYQKLIATDPMAAARYFREHKNEFIR